MIFVYAQVFLIARRQVQLIDKNRLRFQQECPGQLQVHINNILPSACAGHSGFNNGAKRKSTRRRPSRLMLVKEHKALKTLGIIMGTFTICWLPFFVANIINVFYRGIPDWIFRLMNWLGYINSGLNPIIYCRSPEFRTAFKNLLGCPWLSTLWLNSLYKELQTRCPCFLWEADTGTTCTFQKPPNGTTEGTESRASTLRSYESEEASSGPLQSNGSAQFGEISDPGSSCFTLQEMEGWGLYIDKILKKSESTEVSSRPRLRKTASRMSWKKLYIQQRRTLNLLTKPGLILVALRAQARNLDIISTMFMWKTCNDCYDVQKSEFYTAVIYDKTNEKGSGTKQCLVLTPVLQYSFWAEICIRTIDIFCVLL